VLFEDANVIVLSKPAGLLSQGEHTGDENLVDLLRARFGRPYVGLVHRLDRNTSGAMVVAKRTKAAQRLTADLQKGTLTREYLAWLEGRLPAPAEWEDRLLKDEKTNTVRVARGTGGQLARLRVEPLRPGRWRGAEVTLARFVLETGRSHQIRAQSAHRGHPLLGDSKYGARADGFPRPALHSSRVSFEHPISRERLTFEAPLPADMLAVDLSAGEGTSP
jgi:23S rRNA pseudouridine1911/1915/1917 synthase